MGLVIYLIGWAVTFGLLFTHPPVVKEREVMRRLGPEAAFSQAVLCGLGSMLWPILLPLMALGFGGVWFANRVRRFLKAGA